MLLVVVSKSSSVPFVGKTILLAANAGTTRCRTISLVITGRLSAPSWSTAAAAGSTEGGNRLRRRDGHHVRVDERPMKPDYDLFRIPGG